MNPTPFTVRYHMVPGASTGDPTHDNVMRRGLIGKARKSPWIFLNISLKNQSLPAVNCVMLSTYSSDINRGLSPHYLFLEKVNLELLDNKSPWHNKSVSIQKPL